jgi:outer membrane lipoprotein SlyB
LLTGAENFPDEISCEVRPVTISVTVTVTIGLAVGLAVGDMMGKTVGAALHNLATVHHKRGR